jgi:hypothetical protein
MAWVRDLEHDMREFGSNNDYWSQTECEMIVAKESITNVRIFMRGTGIGWVKPIKDSQFWVQRDTEERFKVSAKADSAVNYLTRLKLTNVEETEYNLFVLKEDMRKLSSDFDKYSLGRSKRIRIGLAILINDSKSMFSPGTVEAAQSVLRNLETQIEGVREEAAHFCREIGRFIGEARQNGNLYTEYFEGQIEAMEDTYPEAREHIMEGYNEVY